MVSYSFYVPSDKELKNYEGTVEVPLKISKPSSKNFKLKFISEPSDKEVFEFNGENSRFSIVYNK